MKTVKLAFGLMPGAGEEHWEAILRDGKATLKREELEFTTVGGKLIAINKQADWVDQPNVVREKMKWELCLSNMRLENVTVVYENAIIPWGKRGSDGYLLVDDGITWHITGGVVYVKCQLDLKLISLSVDVNLMTPHELNSLRDAFLEVEWKIEQRIKLTRDVLRLTRAFKSGKKDAGRIKRCMGHLMVDIANV